MKTLVLSPAVYNLAETTRALEVAKACRGLIDTLLANEEAHRKAREFQKVVQAWDDPAIITRFFAATFRP